MMTLYLIRHAEAEGNLYRRIHGQYDSLITDNGYRQIKALEQRFAEVPIDAVYSSDLFRTMTTARAIYVPKHLPLITRADLRELGMGDWEDRSWAGVDREDHEMMWLFSASSPDYRAPNGESYPEMRARGKAAVLDIAAKHPGQTVAVFAHGTIIRNVVAEFLGIGLDQMHTMGHSDNTAVTKLEVEGDHVTVVYNADNSHLSDDISTLARQHWWNKDDHKVDVNLWYQPLDLNKDEDGAYYAACREDAWRNLYGSLERYHSQGFLSDAAAAGRAGPQFLTAAMAGDERVGLLQLDPTKDAKQGAGYISFLYLTPHQRGNGIGVQLIGKAVSIFRPLGRKTLRLVCSEANGPALAFYEKYGFVRTGTTPGAYGTLYQMEKYIGYEYRGELD